MRDSTNSPNANDFRERLIEFKRKREERRKEQSNLEGKDKDDLSKYVDNKIKLLQESLKEKANETIKSEFEKIKSDIVFKFITEGRVITILLSIVGLLAGSFYYTNNRIDNRTDVINGRIDNFGNQVNEIHQILKDQESRQIETKTTKIQSQSKTP